MDSSCRFNIGQIVHHVRFDYRGVIFDVDSNFQGTEEWYIEMAISNPPRNKPWYHVLVDQSSSITYVAERNIEDEKDPKPIQNPLIDQHFIRFENGYYKKDFS